MKNLNERLLKLFDTSEPGNAESATLVGSVLSLPRSAATWVSRHRTGTNPSAEYPY